MASLKHAYVAFTVLLIAASLSGCGTDPIAWPWAETVVKNVLSRGVDASAIDLWTLRDIYYTSVLEEPPASCIMQIDCPKTEVTEMKSFDSTKGFKEEFAQKFGLSLGFSWNGIGAGFNIGTETDSSFSSSTQQNTSWWKITKVGKCAQVRQECIENGTVRMKPEARSILDDLVEEDRLLSATDDEAAMKRWYNRFVQQFGSHIITAVKHGATIQAIHSLDKSCEIGHVCWSFEIGFKFGFVASSFPEVDVGASVDIGYKQKECVDTHECLKDAKSKCAALGGNGGAFELCGSDVPTETVSEFLASGDMDDSSSVINFELMPMQKVVGFFGYPAEVGSKIQQAVEYKSCKKPLGQWTPGDSAGSGHSCKCVLECKNGGILNKDTCSCDCPANEFNGYKGRDCSETFGHCKCGNHKYMGLMEGRCCKGGNSCGSTSEGERVCKDTDVCCNRHEGSTCCPFGTKCGSFRGLGKNPIFNCVPDTKSNKKR